MNKMTEPIMNELIRIRDNIKLDPNVHDRDLMLEWLNDFINNPNQNEKTYTEWIKNISIYLKNIYDETAVNKSMHYTSEVLLFLSIVSKYYIGYDDCDESLILLATSVMYIDDSFI